MLALIALDLKLALRQKSVLFFNYLFPFIFFITFAQIEHADRGGGTMAHALAPTGAKILVLERGGIVPQEPANWDPMVVWGQHRYQAKEQWGDGSGATFAPKAWYVVSNSSRDLKYMSSRAFIHAKNACSSARDFVGLS